MTKREGMFYALGKLSEIIEGDFDCKTVKLEDIYGEKYKRYEIGKFLDSIVMFDVEAPKVEGKLRRMVVSANYDFDVEQIVNILLEGLAYDMKNKKK